MRVNIIGKAHPKILQLIQHLVEFSIHELLESPPPFDLQVTVSLQNQIDDGNTEGFLRILPEGDTTQFRKEWDLHLVYPNELHRLKELIFHECTHLKQALKGELALYIEKDSIMTKSGYKKAFFWKGNFFCWTDDIAYTDDDISKGKKGPQDLPWELEAYFNMSRLSQLHKKLTLG